jgi:hypothetical protein
MMPDGMVPGLQLPRELLDPDGGATGRDSQATVRMLTGHLKYLMAFTCLTCAREFPERYYTHRPPAMLQHSIAHQQQSGTRAMLCAGCSLAAARKREPLAD